MDSERTKKLPGVLLTPEVEAEVDALFYSLAKMRRAKLERELAEAQKLFASSQSETISHIGRIDGIWGKITALEAMVAS